MEAASLGASFSALSNSSNPCPHQAIRSQAMRNRSRTSHDPAHNMATASQHILTTDTVQTLQLSITAFVKACTHPYIIDKTKKCVKPIAIVLVATYFMGTLLFAPIRAVALLVQTITFGWISAETASRSGQQWISDAVAFAPLVTMLIVRSFVRKPMYKCFIHMLREVNPQAAKQIETTPAIRNPNKKSRADRLNDRVDKTFQRAGNMLVLSASLYLWRQIPWVGRLAAPVTHYMTMNRLLGPRRAAICSLVALIDPVEPFVVKFIEVWRASRILAPEVLEPYLAHNVPHADRAAFFRANEFTINAFLAPQMLLMTVPIVGPVVFVPVQAASAWLVDLLARRSAGQMLQQTSNGRDPWSQHGSALGDSHPSRSASMSTAAPTVPASPPIFDQQSFSQPGVTSSTYYQQQ